MPFKIHNTKKILYAWCEIIFEIIANVLQRTAVNNGTIISFKAMKRDQSVVTNRITGPAGKRCLSLSSFCKGSLHTRTISVSGSQLGNLLSSRFSSRPFSPP